MGGVSYEREESGDMSASSDNTSVVSVRRWDHIGGRTAVASEHEREHAVQSTAQSKKWNATLTHYV